MVILTTFHKLEIIAPFKVLYWPGVGDKTHRGIPELDITRLAKQVGQKWSTE